jgi:murein DD-endopeptidase MepM/ murein hydrolase activator NlpD
MSERLARRSKETPSVQIIIVHPRLGEPRTLSITPKLIALAALAGGAIVLAAGMLVSQAAARLPWFADHSEQLRQQAYMRENVKVMARRVGEMQAKLMQLDALGERVAGLAGVTPTFKTKETPGRGGLLVSSRPMSVHDVTTELDRLEVELGDRSDYLSVLDAQLTTLSVRKAMTPTVMPVSQGFDGSSFGWRIDPFTGTRALHEGVDFAAPSGTPIVAAAGGVVQTAEFHSGYGYMIDIDNGNDLVTRYAHISRLLVKPGDLVKRGQKIALVGSTGRSTGAHLHFEVRLGGIAVNPNNFLSQGQGGQTPQTFKHVVTLSGPQQPAGTLD